MAKSRKKKILLIPKELSEYLLTIKITKRRVDTGDRIKSIEKHLKNGKTRYATIQLKSLSREAEKLHREAEYIQHLSYIFFHSRKDDADIPF